jgi:hypothetical protein
LVNDSLQFAKSRILQLANSLIVLVLGCSCTSTTSPTAPAIPGPTVDVLAYLLGDAATWPRLGSHHQNQIVDLARREICWVKYGNPRRFECWRWDDEFVYHAVDHGLDGDSNESYRFTDGRWITRFLPAGATIAAPWSIDVAQNQLVWYDAACGVDASRSHLFPYRQRAWFEPRRDAGGDLGARDTLVLEYQPYDPVGAAGAAERFYFGRGAGWYEWTRSGFQDLFNRLGGPSTAMDRTVWCQ